MTTVTPMATVTTTDATLLHLMWLASPALPVGAFSYSEGLETAVEEGRVTDETQAATWLTDQPSCSPSHGRGPWRSAMRMVWPRVAGISRAAQLPPVVVGRGSYPARVSASMGPR